MDPLSSVMFVFGLVLLAVSWLLLLQLSFQEDFAWGMATLFVPPLSYLYSCFAWEKSQDLLYAAGAGWVLLILSYS
jgi:hypothetical protein